MCDIVLYQPLLTSQLEERTRQWYQLKFKFRESTIELTQEEIKLANLEIQIYLFERQYFSSLGNLFLQLDEIKAQASQHNYNCHQEEIESNFKPSKALKKLFHRIAKLIHPDLTTNPLEKHMRHLAFLELKKAYETGNQERLEFFLQNLCENSIQSFSQEGEKNTEEDVATEIWELNTKILQVQNRLEVIKSQLKTLKKHPFYELRQKAIACKQKGQNLLAQMARNLQNEINKLTQQLQELKGEI